MDLNNASKKSTLVLNF